MWLVSFLKKLNVAEEKLLFAFFAVFVIVGMAFAGIHWPSLQTVFSTFVGGVVSTFAVYAGSNIANKWVDSRSPSIDDYEGPPPPNPLRD